MAAKFNYLRLARTADRLIKRFGQEETIVAYVDMPNDAQPNRPGTRVPIQIAVSGVFLSIDEKLIDGELIKLGDMKVLVSALGLALPPKLKGTITRTDEQEVWSIEDIKPLNPGGVKLIYTLQVRK